MARKIRRMASVIDQHFSKDEINALERGSIDLEAISPALLVPFAARRLESARVIWLNVRWFLQHGIDVLDGKERHRVELWLIEEFGFAVIGDPSTWPARAIKQFHADRYGSTEGTTPHGGSGRSGIAGRFCAKGIGVTPLVGKDAAPGHAHGCATLEECVREAVYGEIIDAEFPFGAVPVIGILDTGLEFADPDAQTNHSRRARRGILIRQNVLRPAHAERAPLFHWTSANESQNRLSQQKDVMRTRAVVRCWLDGDFEVPAIKELIARIACQIAFGQVHRISSGGMFSSNVSITGALLDFGNAHALSDWSRAKLLDHAAGFGDEMITLCAIIRSLAFYLNKYASSNSRMASERELQNYAVECHRECFEQECLRLFNLSEPVARGEKLTEVLRAHFREQQQRCVRYRHGRVDGPSKVASDRPWLGDILASAGKCETYVARPCLLLLQSIDTCLKEAFKGTHDPGRFVAGAYMTARRYFLMRKEIDRGRLMDTIMVLLKRVMRSEHFSVQEIEAAVDRIVGKSRSHWRMLPTHLVVRAKKAFGSSCALICADLIRGGQCVWLEGVGCADRLYLFDHWLTDGLDELQSLQISNGRWQASVPMESILSWFSSSSEISEVVRMAPGGFDSYDASLSADEAALLMASGPLDWVCRKDELA